MINKGKGFPEVLGFGAPIVDYIFEVTEEFVDSLSGVKGGMVSVDYKTFVGILTSLKQDPLLFVGGSAANTTRGLARFGHHCNFVGKLGADTAGRKFRESMVSLDIGTSGLLSSTSPTGQVICLVTPDKERTMRTFLGASKELTTEDIHQEMFEHVSLVHVEGYLLLNKPVAQKILELAKEANAKVSFDLGSFEMVAAYKDTVVKFITRYVDILFANLDETHALTKLEPNKGCDVLRDLCETVVVLMGGNGCYAASGTEQIYQPAFLVESPVDTTGAGDLFASGFIHGVLKGCSLAECARFGALSGAAVVQVKGVEMPHEQWVALKRQIAQEASSSAAG